MTLDSAQASLWRLPRSDWACKVKMTATAHTASRVCMQERARMVCWVGERGLWR